MKKYIGDGVYASRDNNGIVCLTTENGYSVTNTIYLELETIESLIRFLKEDNDDEWLGDPEDL